MRHMEAERLHNIAGTLLECAGHLRKGVRCKKFPRLFQPPNILYTGLYIFSRHIRTGMIFFQHGRHDLFRRMRFIKANDVIGHFIHDMDTAGAGVQHNIISVQLVLVYHFKPPLT